MTDEMLEAETLDCVEVTVTVPGASVNADSEATERGRISEAVGRALAAGLMIVPTPLLALAQAAVDIDARHPFPRERKHSSEFNAFKAAASALLSATGGKDQLQ